MPRRIGVFSAESRAEGVYLAQGQGTDFCLELPGDREVGRAAKEVGFPVYVAFLCAGQIIEVKGGYAEHFTGPFCIASRDDGRVEIVEPIVVVELVDGERHCMANPEHGAKGIGAHAEVRFGAQELHRLPFGLQGIFVEVVFPQDFQVLGDEFDGLSAALRLH